MSVLLSQSQIDSLVQYLRKCLPNLQAIYLFGSYANDLATDKSDIDIGFFTDKQENTQNTSELALELSTILKKDVDCIDLKSTNTVLAVQIVSTGKLLYFLDKNAVDFFEITIFSMYAELNEERKEIIADVLKRGSVYGK